MSTLSELATEGMDDPSLDELERKRAAWSLAPTKADGDTIALVTSRPGDINSGTRYRMLEQMQLVYRYRKWVAVAASRNACAVASVQPRVLRIAPKGGQMRTRRLAGFQIKNALKNGGHLVRKAIGTYREGWEEITDDRHPLVKLIEKPSPDTNWFELIELTQTFQEIAGNGYWAKVKGQNNLTTEIHSLYPQFCEIKPDSSGAVGLYIYGNYSNPNKLRLAPDTVVHFKFPNPWDVWYGLAPLARCVDEADLSIEMTKFARSFLDNGAIGGANVFVPNANKDQLNAIKAEWDALYAGARHGNATRFINGRDTKIEYPPQLDKNPIMKESENAAREIIAGCFDIPVGLLNMEEKSLANGKVVLPHWQKMSIKPRVQRMEDKINEDLVPEFREALRDPTLIVVFDNCVDEDREALTAEIRVLRPGKATITCDEARAMLGMPPATPEQMEELEPPEPEPMGAGGEDKPKKESQKAIVWHGGHEHAIEYKKITDEIRITVDTLSELIEKVLRKYAPIYAENPMNNAMGVNVQVQRGMIVELAGVMDMPIAKTYITGYNGGVREVNGHAPNTMMLMDALTKDARTFLDSWVIKSSTSIVNTYEDRIRTVISDGIGQGATTGEIAREIRTVIPTEAPASALRIARTETMRALAGGKDNAYADSKIVDSREWLLSGNPCKICRAVYAEHRYAKVGEPFVKQGTIVGGVLLDYSDVNGSDAHPNCSCGVGAVFKPIGA